MARVDNIKASLPFDDGGDGTATMVLGDDDRIVAERMARRVMSDPAADPLTGAERGAGPGAGLTGRGDEGGAGDIHDAAASADALAHK